LRQNHRYYFGAWFLVQLAWAFCLRQKTTSVSAFCVWTGAADMSLCSRVCSIVNYHRDYADGNTLFCQIVTVLKALGDQVIPKSCG
jgi:hypothetical protein